MIEEVITHQDKFYILADSHLADERTRVLKQGGTFAVFDRFGDIHPHAEQGLFHSETRFLSQLDFKLDGRRPFLLSSSVLNDNTLLAVHVTNLDVLENGKIVLPRGILHIYRTKFLLDGVCYERFQLAQYSAGSLAGEISLRIESDFRDIFEVRGIKRSKRGELFAPLSNDGALIFGYKGLDGVTRRTRVSWKGADGQVRGNNTIIFPFNLKPREIADYFVEYACLSDKNGAAPVESFGTALDKASSERKNIGEGQASVFTDNEQFNHWLNRSNADLNMLTSRLPEGFYPFAGIPWFSTVFGRDGIFTALFCLWNHPGLARGVLGHLAAHQAKAEDPANDAAPGKILHETRKGEMAALREVPFGFYYGSIDVTPLFVVLAGAYADRTGDLEFIRTIWPNIEAALGWAEKYGDPDADGFLEYERKHPTGLLNQGWKDSEDSIFHADGHFPSMPVALCEVQGYLFDAYVRAASLADRLGRAAQAADWRVKAARLKEKFLSAFWSSSLGMYALALDGDKRPCLVRTSNAGHCLWSGIAEQEHVRQMAESFMGQEFFSGWGVRTLASSEIRYNPMSYHDGSVWPHDNAVIAAGLSRYGYKDAAAKILQGMFDASLYLDLQRLPELFCGFERRAQEGPTLYPVACSPQAWASAAVFSLLQSILGMKIDGFGGRIIFEYPVLPEFLPALTLKGINVGTGQADIVLRRHRDNNVSVEILSRSGRVDVVTYK